MLTPLDRWAARIPLARRHRQRSFGILAPHAPLRAAVTALASSRAETPAAQTPTLAPGAPPTAPTGASTEATQAELVRERLHHPRAAIPVRFSRSVGALSPNHDGCPDRSGLGTLAEVALDLLSVILLREAVDRRGSAMRSGMGGGHQRKRHANIHPSWGKAARV